MSADTAAQPDNNDEKKGSGPGNYTIEQAISDRAQLHTIAFNGLAFITGNYGADLFFPPGKAADYFGFQFMRDNDSNELGHNTSFLTRIAENVLNILNDEQKQLLNGLARSQEEQFTGFAQKRFVIIKAFRKKLENPALILNRDSVIKYFTSLYETDAKLSYSRAEVMGKIINSLSDGQKKILAGMSFLNSSTWPEAEHNNMGRKKLPHMQDVAVMTYASEFFSWYKGSVDADAYFCPERHGTYFGGFYLKDSPAMNNPGYSISTKLTGESGERFLKILNDKQRNLLQEIIINHKSDLNKIVSTRKDISKELRKFIQGNVPDEAPVTELAKQYGSLDGELSLSYAEAFAEIYRTLSSSQRSEINELRGSDILPEGGFLYSDTIALPEPDCDFLFR
jgi:hypothetical protein